MDWVRQTSPVKWLLLARAFLCLCGAITFVAAFSLPQVNATESTLKVANSKAWKPFSYLDEHNQPAGILIDFWREYAARNQVEVEFVLLDWNESIVAVREGQADVHAGLMWSKPREEFFDYGEPLFTIETQLYYSQEALSVDVNTVLEGGTQDLVGVVEGGYEEHYARTEFPQANLKLYANNQKMIEGAFSGEVNAFIADLHVANFYLYSTSHPTKFVPVKFLYSGDIFPAVAEGNSALIESVDAGFNKLSNDERTNILNRWIHVETVYPNFFTPLAIGAVSLAVLLYIVLLRRTVKARTIELERANQQLTTLSLTDELTQIHNRRYFMERLKEIKPQNRPIAVMVFDIDDFKAINDTWGHAVGDEVIRLVADAAKESLGPDILMARVGGEEFALLAFDLDYCEAHDQAESLCAAVSAIKLDTEAIAKVSVSLGCAYYQSPDSVLDLIAADRLMYQAKTWGKNRAVSEIVD